MKVVRSPWFRGAVTLGLLAVVANKIDWSRVSDRLVSGNPGWLAVAVACVVTALVVGAIRWRALLEGAAIHIPVGELSRIYAVSTFAQSFLPGAIGGDVTRVLMVARDGVIRARSASTVVLDRAGALAGLLIVTWGAVLIGGGREPTGAIEALAWATVAAIVAAAIAAAVIVRRPALLTRLVPDRWRDLARGVWEVAHRLIHDWRAIAFLVGTSIVFQALMALQICALARCLGDTLSFPAAAVTLTLVTFATLIPLSIGGFGIREGSYVLLLGSVGISATDATLISLGTVLVLLIASLPGAVLLAMHGLRPALGAESP